MPCVVFLSAACLFDRKSGAAQSVRAHLKALARAGWSAHSVTLNTFDGVHDPVWWSGLEGVSEAPTPGTELEVLDDGLTHHLCVSHSTTSAEIRPWEWRTFQRSASSALARLKPDVVVTYGGRALDDLLAQAHQRGARTVFYLGSPGYAFQPEHDFKYIDVHLMPSQAMVDLYRDKRGIEGRVLRTRVCAPMEGRRNLAPERIASRRERFVTMINPEPAKGGLFFLNLVAQAEVMAPELRFRAVESRWGRAQWEAQGINAALLDRVEWMPHTRELGHIFEECSLLLVPSLWFEAAGRVVAESLLAGVPVLAMRSGGIEEQLNGGGLLFDLPPELSRNYLGDADKQDLHRWVQVMRVLMDDDRLYHQAVRLALKASSIHAPGVAEAAAIQTFNDIVALPASPSLRDNPEAVARLAALRERMNQHREKVNLRLEQHPATSVGEARSPATPGPYGELLKMSLAQPLVRDALEATKSGDLATARRLLEAYLRLLPEDITALGMLAEVAQREDRLGEARRLMEAVVELAPGFVEGHHQLIRLMHEQRDAEATLPLSFRLLEASPHHPRYLALHASLLVSANRFDEGIRVFDALFRQCDGSAHDWMQYGLALKTLGRQAEAVAAYRRAIGMAPHMGTAWHALSNTKLALFTAEDVELMRAQLTRADISEHDRFNLHFALGKAMEDMRQPVDSFRHYAEANRTRKLLAPYDPSLLDAYVSAVKETMTAQFFEERRTAGDPDPAPIFVLGLHRAGSTLVEQILASHPMVEGTRELSAMLSIGRDFGSPGDRPRQEGTSFQPDLTRSLRPDEWTDRGRAYLQATRCERRTQRPYFIDKMPANWMYTWLIQLALPHARIIDIRRHPMSAGFALFKMNFGLGVNHSYDLYDIGRYYRAYVELMSHFDEVLPGRVHHIQYERLVDDTEGEVRRLLTYCGLPFADSCLRYWETERAIQTPSSEQVRRPIYKDALEAWIPYADWLTPLREGLGDLVDERGEPRPAALVYR